MKKHVKCINLPYSLVKPEAVLLLPGQFFSSRVSITPGMFLPNKKYLREFEFSMNLGGSGVKKLSLQNYIK